VTQVLKRLLLALAICLIILIALVLPGFGQRKPAVVPLPPFSDTTYRVGERLTYNVSYANFVSAGHVELFVPARGTFYGREAIQLRAHVQTTGVVSVALFALNTDYTSYVDPTTGQPFRVEQVERDAPHGADSSHDLNQEGAPAAVPEKSRMGGFPGTYDFLSVLYRLRSLPLAEGSTYLFTVKGESGEYPAEIRVKGHETIRTNVGSFNAIATQVRVANNSAANDYRIQVYFTDDERHVPVLLTAKLQTGELRAELAGSQMVAVAKAPGKPAATPTPQPTPVRSPTPTTGVPPKTALLGLPFKVGEQLNYKAYLANVQESVGQVSFQIRSRARYFDHDGLLFTVTAQTTNAAQRLFVANDVLSSYVDPESLLPFRTDLNLAEGQRHSQEVWTINQDYGTATNGQGRKIDMPVGTHDYLSLFYVVRTMNLVPPKKTGISILVNGRPKTLFINAVKRETIQLGSEKIPSIQLELTTDDPQPDKFVLRAWISDDDRRLPLRFTAMTQLGQLRVDLAILPLTRQ
jgi:hypothetical protein